METDRRVTEFTFEEFKNDDFGGELEMGGFFGPRAPSSPSMQENYGGLNPPLYLFHRPEIDLDQDDFFMPL